MQEISINYTLATGADPDVKIASTNCHNSHVLLRNYELDTTGQAERDELAQVRADITMHENLIAFTKDLINSQAMVGPADSWGRVTLLSPKPSPPPPPPPVAELVGAWAPRHPPAPPETVGGRALVARYEGNLLDLEAREDELVLELNDCFVRDRAAGTVCGLNSNEAPRALQPALGLARAPPCTLYAPPPFSWAGAAPVDGARRRQVPRLRHALDARGRLLRLCAAHSAHAAHARTRARAHRQAAAATPADPRRVRSQTGSRTPTRWRPRPRSCARSCSRSAPFA